MRGARAGAGAALVAPAATPAPVPAVAQTLRARPKCTPGPHRRFRIPSGSMKPTPEPNDCVVVRLVRDDPSGIEPGGIVVFVPTGMDHPFAMRVVALGGRRVAMEGGRPVIDGAPVAAELRPDCERVMEPEGDMASMPRCPEPTPRGETCAVARRAETLPDGVIHEVLDLGPGHLDDTAEVTVPEGHVSVLGDDRDDAEGGRSPVVLGGPGTVPLHRVIGVVEEIR